MLMLASSNALAQERVTFPSADGKTTLTGYVFMPAKRAERMPAVVMMHGRGGAYSTAAKGRYDASTISQRHRDVGRSVGGERLRRGAGRQLRPARLSGRLPALQLQHAARRGERGHVRPLDAYGALAWLRTRKDVDASASDCRAGRTAAAPRSPPWRRAPALRRTSIKGFNAALAFYPACRLRGRFDDRLSAVRAGAGVSWHRRRGDVVPTLPRAGRTQPQGRRRHHDHDLSRRGARLRRSRPRAAGEPRQCQSEGGRDGARAAFLRRAGRGAAITK